MILDYFCLICLRYCEHSLDKMRRDELFLNFDNDTQHRPLCIDCRKILEELLIKECFINPLDRSYRKPSAFFKREKQRKIDVFFNLN